MAIIADLLLCFAVLVSANVTLAWAEMATFDLAGDKSSLAGTGAVPILMLMRWLLLAVALLIGIGRGGFGFLPGGRWAQTGIVLGVHVLLGVVSLKGFTWIVDGIQANNPGPQQFAIAFAFVLPLVTFFGALWAIHREWAARHWLISLGALALLVAGHVGGWRSGLRNPRPAATPAAAEAPPAES
ncbi:MAG: hypothetical protein AB7L66_09165 [Gemmatimonadales bacterium]